MNAETTPPALTPDERRQRVFEWLDAHSIRYTWYEHPEAPTIEIARQYWRNDGSKHCKNLFFRNHRATATTWSRSMPSSRWPSTTSNTVCTRASCRLPPSNAWSAGSGCGPARYRPSG